MHIHLEEAPDNTQVRLVVIPGEKYLATIGAYDTTLMLIGTTSGLVVMFAIPLCISVATTHKGS